MHTSEGARDWATWGIGWGLGILLLLAFAGVLPILVIVILKFTNVVTLGQVTHGWSAVAYSAETELSFGAAGVIAWAVAARRYWFGGPWRWRLWIKGVVGGLALGATLTMVGVGMQEWLGKTLPSDAKDLVGPVGHHPGPLIGMLIVIALLAPVMEEWFFRGTLQTSLAGAVGTPVAVGVVSIIFALAHQLDSPHPLAQPWLWAPILPLAVVLGIVRVRTDSMSGNVGIHMGFNLWAALLMSLQFWR